jgi:hypothetical protein
MGIRYIYIYRSNNERFSFHNLKELVDKVNETSSYKINVSQITNYYSGRIKNPKPIYNNINRWRI